MTYQPKHLTRWTLPDSYAGPEWPEWFSIYGQHSDSDSLTRSNFACILKELGGESETVRVIRERHWAVGWIEWIGVHERDSKALEIADGISKDLEGYPVVNEDHWSQLESDEAFDYWQRMSVRERVEWCRDADVSIFAARRDNDLPSAVEQAIVESGI